MSGKNKIIKKTNQNPKNQRAIIGWLFNQSFGKELISTLGKDLGFQNVTAKENQPSFSFMSKKSKNKLNIPKLYYGIREEKQPWVVGVYTVPRSRNLKQAYKSSNKYLESLDKIAEHQNVKTALLIISDEEISKPEGVSSSLTTISWKNFLSTVSSVVDKNLNVIPPFKHETISKWLNQWSFAETFKELENQHFENLKTKVKIPYKLGNSRFTVKSSEKGSPVSVHGSIKNLSHTSGKLVLNLALQKKGTKNWRRQWDVALPGIERKLSEAYASIGYTPKVKAEKPVEEINKKVLKKLAKKRNRLRFEFPIEWSSNQWNVSEKTFSKSLGEIVSTYIEKVNPLLTWKQEKEEDEEDNEPEIVSAEL